MSSDSKNNWVQEYLYAVLEADVEKMPDRIVSARDAIAERLGDLEGSSDHHAERHEMQAALSALITLEVEASIWPPASTHKKETK